MVPYSINTEMVETLQLNSQDGGDTILINDLSGVTDLTAVNINSGEGEDTINAGFANFPITIEGGDDFDNIIGGSGNDILTGGTGDDTLVGGSGDDLFIWNHGDGSDRIDGNGDTDTVQVNGSNDASGDTFTINANDTGLTVEQTTQSTVSLDVGTTEILEVNALAGRDIITVGDLSNVIGLTELRLLGDADADNIDVSDLPAGVVSTLTIDGGTGNDILTGSPGNEILNGGPGADRMTGGPGDDQISGDEDGDAIVWNDGDGNDTIDGGTGVDTVEVNSSIDTTTGDLLTVRANGEEVQVERTNLAPFTLDIRMTEAVQLNSQDGDDTITANDLTGVADLANLVVNGGLGVDIVQIDGSGDESTGDDLAITADGTSVRIERTNPKPFAWDINSIETLEVNSQAGNDAITISDLSGITDLITLNLDGGVGNDIIDAMALPAGVVAAVTLTGNNGNDTVTGSSGVDTLIGGLGG